MKVFRWWMAGLLALAAASGHAWPGWLPEPPGALTEPLGSLLLWQWLGFLVIGALSLLAGYVVFRLLAALFRLSRHTRGLLASLESGRGVKRASALLVATFAFQGGALQLELPDEVWQQLSSALLVVRILVTGFILAAAWDAFCDGIADRTGGGGHRARALLIPFAQKFGRFVLFTIALVAAVGSLGYNVGAVIAGLGIGGVAVALAAKDSIENLFGTLTLVLDLPFGVGDWVKIGTVDGTVEEINLRSTRIRTVDDSLITLPNSNLIRASVENMGRRRFRRFKSELRVRNAVEPDELAEFCDQIRGIVASHSSVVGGSGRVHLTEIGLDTFAIQLECKFDAEDLGAELDARHALLMDVIALSKRSNVVLGPLPGTWATPVPPGAAANTNLP